MSTSIDGLCMFCKHAVVVHVSEGCGVVDCRCQVTWQMLSFPEKYATADRMDSSINSPGISLTPKQGGGFTISVDVPPAGLSPSASDVILGLFRDMLSLTRMNAN